MQVTKVRDLRVLDFDIENRPLSYLGGDFTTAEITAIAASFGTGDMHCWLLGRDDPVDILEGFRALYNEADIVTGHYIRRHDLPIINGAMLEYGLAPLTAKLCSDTKMDMLTMHDISRSQESIAGMLGIEAPKVHMTQPMWRAANRLEHIEYAEKRVTADVRQHQAMRKKLIELRMLRAPRMWIP